MRDHKIVAWFGFEMCSSLCHFVWTTLECFIVGPQPKRTCKWHNCNMLVKCARCRQRIHIHSGHSVRTSERETTPSLSLLVCSLKTTFPAIINIYNSTERLNKTCLNFVHEGCMAEIGKGVMGDKMCNTLSGAIYGARLGPPPRLQCTVASAAHRHVCEWMGTLRNHIVPVVYTLSIVIGCRFCVPIASAAHFGVAFAREPELFVYAEYVCNSILYGVYINDKFYLYNFHMFVKICI